jgi:hypothetical protein
VRVAIRQTVLTVIDHLEFDEPVDFVPLVDHSSGSLLTVHTANGRQFTRGLSSPYVSGQATYVPACVTHTHAECCLRGRIGRMARKSSSVSAPVEKAGADGSTWRILGPIDA